MIAVTTKPRKRPKNVMVKVTYLDELEQLRQRNVGVLRGEDVVKFARNPKTALHSKFEWDDAKASHEYRLWQARKVIAVFVKTYQADGDPIRAYVSLTADRVEPGGGYRLLDDVMANSKKRQALLDEAMAELERLEVKYGRLKELAGVFAAVKRVRGRKKATRRRKPQPR